MNKELEEAVKVLKDMKDGSNICLTIELDRDKKDKEDIEHYESEVKAIETVLNYIENSIPKKKVEEKFEEVKYRLNETMITEKDTYYNLGKQAILKELLEVE